MSRYCELAEIVYSKKIFLLNVDFQGNWCLDVGIPNDYDLVKRDGNNLIKIGTVAKAVNKGNLQQFVFDDENNIYANYDGYIHMFSAKGVNLGSAESICIDRIIGIDDEDIFVTPQTAPYKQISVIRKKDLYPYDEFLIPGGFQPDKLRYDRATKEFSYIKNEETIFFDRKGKELRKFPSYSNCQRRVKNGKSYSFETKNLFLIIDNRDGERIDQIPIRNDYTSYDIGNDGEIIFTARNKFHVFLPKTNCVSHLFSAIILYSDEYLKMKDEADELKKRFFQICLQLPMELQMVIAHRLYQSGKQNVLSVDSEKYFREILN